MMKGFLLTVLISLLFLTSASCSGNYFTHNGEIWGTTYHIVYQNGQNIDNELDSIMRYVDAELSMFNPASLVSAINSGESDSISVALGLRTQRSRDTSLFCRNLGSAIGGRYIGVPDRGVPHYKKSPGHVIRLFVGGKRLRHRPCVPAS